MHVLCSLHVHGSRAIFTCNIDSILSYAVNIYMYSAKYIIMKIQFDATDVVQVPCTVLVLQM